MKNCKALKFTCKNCKKPGHFTEVCQQKDAKVVSNEASKDESESEEEKDTFRLNVFELKVDQQSESASKQVKRVA